MKVIPFVGLIAALDAATLRARTYGHPWVVTRGRAGYNVMRLSDAERWGYKVLETCR